LWTPICVVFVNFLKSVHNNCSDWLLYSRMCYFVTFCVVFLTSDLQSYLSTTELNSLLYIIAFLTLCSLSLITYFVAAVMDPGYVPIPLVSTWLVFGFFETLIFIITYVSSSLVHSTVVLTVAFKLIEMIWLGHNGWIKSVIVSIWLVGLVLWTFT
jgi:hypothetical protein